jgi:hypothetical protein
LEFQARRSTGFLQRNPPENLVEPVARNSGTHPGQERTGHQKSPSTCATNGLAAWRAAWQCKAACPSVGSWLHGMNSNCSFEHPAFRRSTRHNQTGHGTRRQAIVCRAAQITRAPRGPKTAARPDTSPELVTFTASVVERVSGEVQAGQSNHVPSSTVIHSFPQWQTRGRTITMALLSACRILGWAGNHRKQS